MKNDLYFNFRDICNRSLWDTGYLVKKLQGYGILRLPLMGPHLQLAGIFISSKSCSLAVKSRYSSPRNVKSSAYGKNFVGGAEHNLPE